MLVCVFFFYICVEVKKEHYRFRRKDRLLSVNSRI